MGVTKEVTKEGDGPTPSKGQKITVLLFILPHAQPDARVLQCVVFICVAC